MITIKPLLVFCVLLSIRMPLTAKLVIADTIGQEKAVRVLASGLQPERNIDIQPESLSAALRDLRQGKIDMLLSRYKLDSKQREKFNVSCYRYALEPVIFVISSRNRIISVSKKQLQDVLRGNILTWKPLGGEAYSIHLGIVRDGEPGIGALYREVLKKADLKAKFFEASNAKGISVLASMQDGFLGVCGYINLPLAAKTLAVDGIRPTIANIQSGRYPAVTEYWIWISAREDHAKTLNHKASVEFIELLRSKKTAPLIERCGLLPSK
ncbi:MAG: hypothetical protein PHV59_09610 [Victivallales bacterium]|nr:hypothetical protein [Victivallales bacterium]